MNEENIIRHLDNQEKINKSLLEFVHQKEPYFTGGVMLDNYDVYWKINTSCNCHPEYSWEKFDTLQSFCKWLDAKNINILE